MKKRSKTTSTDKIKYVNSIIDTWDRRKNKNFTGIMIVCGGGNRGYWHSKYWFVNGKMHREFETAVLYRKNQDYKRWFLYGKEYVFLEKYYKKLWRHSKHNPAKAAIIASKLLALKEES